MIDDDEEGIPFSEPDPELNALSRAVIGAAIEVHRYLGPGLDEIMYEKALKHELHVRRILFVDQFLVDIKYKGEIIGQRRLDLLVGGKLIVELKAVENIAPIHMAQLRTYLKMTRLTLGLLINFNSVLLKDGIKRIISH